MEVSAKKAKPKPKAKAKSKPKPKAKPKAKPVKKPTSRLKANEMPYSYYVEKAQELSIPLSKSGVKKTKAQLQRAIYYRTSKDKE